MWWVISCAFTLSALSLRCHSRATFHLWSLTLFLLVSNILPPLCSFLCPVALLIPFVISFFPFFLFPFLLSHSFLILFILIPLSIPLLPFLFPFLFSYMLSSFPLFLPFLPSLPPLFFHFCFLRLLPMPCFPFSCLILLVFLHFYRFFLFLFAHIYLFPFMPYPSPHVSSSFIEFSPPYVHFCVL